MEKLYEQAVMWYVLSSGRRFICPQFSIPSGTGGDWSCPDFVALDFQDKTVYVVEVTMAAAADDLVKKVLGRESQWFSRLKVYLSTQDPSFGSWRYRAAVFVRSEIVEAFDRKIGSPADVAVFPFERALFSWRWEWQGQRSNNALERAGA
jgi:hypothetical protein